MLSPQKILSVTLLALASQSCITASYSAPAGPPPRDLHKQTVNRSFDDTWNALIQYASGTFFEITNFEKESGLLTLSFGSANPSRFVDGGHWKMSGSNLAGQSMEFDGNYVDFLAIHHRGRLQGRMNIFVRELSASSTEVTVNAKYVFTASTQDSNGRAVTDTWSFESGGSHSVAVRNPAQGTSPTRTLRPTYKAEQAILRALKD